MVRKTDDRKRKRQKINETADADVHNHHQAQTTESPDLEGNQNDGSDVKLDETLDGSPLKKQERLLRPRGKDSPMEMSPDNSKKMQSSEHGDGAADTLLSFQQLTQSNKQFDQASSPFDMEKNNIRTPMRQKQFTESTELERLRMHIEGLGGNLQDGWHVNVNRRNKAGKLSKSFISPNNERFRSRTEVAKHLGLNTDRKPQTKAVNDGLGSEKQVLKGHVQYLDLAQRGLHKRDKKVNTNAASAVLSDKRTIGKKATLASAVTQRCEDALRSIISTDNFAALSNMLSRNSMAGSFEASLQTKSSPLIAGPLDLQLIHIRLSTGAYGQTPELFFTDIQQVWKNIISTGNELVALATSLAELSNNLYKQQILTLLEATEKIPRGTETASKESMKGNRTTCQHDKQVMGYNGERDTGNETNVIQPSRPDKVPEKGSTSEEVIPPASPAKPSCTVDNGISIRDVVPSSYDHRQASLQDINSFMNKSVYKSRTQKNKKHLVAAGKPRKPDKVIADNSPKTVCRKCGLESNSEYIVCKDCHECYHIDCTGSALNGTIPVDWTCATCKSSDKKAAWKESREDICTEAMTETSTEDLKARQKPGTCEICRRGDHNVLFCDRCNAAFHMDCLNPPLDTVPQGYWYCPRCNQDENVLEDCTVFLRMPKDSLDSADNESIEHTSFKDTSPADIIGRGSTKNPSLECSASFRQSADEETRQKSPELSTGHVSQENSFGSSPPDISFFMVENENACKICGVESKRSAVSCSGCLKRFHLNCLKPSLKKLPRKTWYCPSCLCRACKIDADDEKILLCDNCDEGYHTYCLDPPLSDIPEGAWFCPSCARSKSMVPNSPSKVEVMKRKRKSTEPRRSI